MIEKLKNSKIAYWTQRLICPLLLFLYSFNHLCFGVEWTDTGYNYANYVNMDRMDPMWKYSTYLAHAVGNLLTKLPFGDRMIGLNFYTGLTIAGLALAGYFFFTRKIKIPFLMVFVGEVSAIGLCWCPTALLYNYLTYLLMFVAVVCLYKALSEDKKLWFIIAGIVLGLNVFVRFSNLAQMAFIVGVWAYGIICKKKLKEICAWTGWCVLGYVIGFGGLFAYVCATSGVSDYISGITRILNVGENASSYSIFSMVEVQLRNYLQNLIWLGHMVPFLLFGFVGFAVLPKRLVLLKKVGYVGCMAVVFYWLRNQDMYNFNYDTLESTFQWAVCLMTFTIGLGVYIIFSKKWENQDKILIGFSILIVLLTPLGSNNHLLASMNNLFFVLPVILWILWKALGKLPENKVFTVKGKELFLYSYPLKALVCMIVAMLLVQSFLMGNTYLFRENAGRKNLNTSIENSDILKGMYTTEEKAEALGEIITYVSDNDLKGREVILYGDIPALSYYLEMPYAIGTPWPDLPSYGYEIMCVDLQKVKDKMKAGGQAPVVMIESSYVSGLVEILTSNYDEEFILGEDKKFNLLITFIHDYGYELTFVGEKVTIFERPAQ